MLPLLCLLNVFQVLFTVKQLFTNNPQRSSPSLDSYEWQGEWDGMDGYLEQWAPPDCELRVWTTAESWETSEIFGGVPSPWQFTAKWFHLEGHPVHLDLTALGIETAPPLAIGWSRLHWNRQRYPGLLAGHEAVILLLRISQQVASNCIAAIIVFLFPFSSSVLVNSFYLNSQVFFCFQLPPHPTLRWVGGKGANGCVVFSCLPGSTKTELYQREEIRECQVLEMKALWRWRTRAADMFAIQKAKCMLGCIKSWSREVTVLLYFTVMYWSFVFSYEAPCTKSIWIFRSRSRGDGAPLPMGMGCSAWRKIWGDFITAFQYLQGLIIKGWERDCSSGTVVIGAEVTFIY